MAVMGTQSLNVRPCVTAWMVRVRSGWAMGPVDRRLEHCSEDAKEEAVCNVRVVTVVWRSILVSAASEPHCGN
jgi:hypothetical protein